MGTMLFSRGPYVGGKAPMETIERARSNGVDRATHGDSSNNSKRVQQSEATASDAARLQAVVARVLSPGGALSRVLPGFESRPQQVHMSEAIAHVLHDGGVGLIEAGTGTGKSLAYLVPAALFGRRRRVRVIVSTHTHNLQEQLLRNDIPLLQKALGEDVPFEAAVMKGWSNYVCLMRLQQAALGQQQLFPEQRRTVERLQRWCDGGDHTGARDAVGFHVSDEIWSDVHAESDTCLRQRCQFYDDCFYFRARREAQAADILIANHHLVCADFAVREQVGWDTEVSVLPRADHVVFDEAHHLEDVFTQHFGLSFGRARVHRLLQRIQGKTGFAARLQRLITQHPDGEEVQALATALAGAVPKAVSQAQRDADEFFAHVAQLAQTSSGSQRRDADGGQNGGAVPLQRGMIETRFWQPLGDSLEHLQTLLSRLAKDVQAWPEDVPETDALAWEAEALARRAEAAAADLTSLAEVDDGQLVYWLEQQGRRREEWALRGAPVQVGPVVRQTLLDNVGSAVLTSATLSAGDQFDYFKHRLGLDDCSRITAEERIASPFDYENQVLLGLPADLPSPEQPAFLSVLAAALQQWLTASRGRAFVLFTSYRALNEVYHQLQPWLQRQGMTPLRQTDMGRAQLLERFRRSDKPVLFGTDSFWEGVDVPGAALSLVVVTRLPFRVPTDPVATARREALEEQGKDAFMHLTVPQAVMRLRQGFGRLIRKGDDRGAVIIADNRIVRRRYGSNFLAALPPCQQQRGSTAAVAAAVADWLD